MRVVAAAAVRQVAPEAVQPEQVRADWVVAAMEVATNKVAEMVPQIPAVVVAADILPVWEEQAAPAS